MKSLTDEAIVTGGMDYRDADRIVHLYTRDHGRISGIARGAKKSVKRFGGAFELFARVTVNFLPAENLSSLKSAEPITIYQGIRKELDKISFASYAVELLAALTPERLPNKRVFRLLVAYLEHLDSFAADPSDRHFFEINLLNILGYRPPLESCPSCGADLMVSGGRWSESERHLLCIFCTKKGEMISPSGVSRLITSMNTGRFGQVRFSDDDIGGIDRFMESFILANTGRALKSLAFLRLSP
ncbi:MAG: DNA repair protein RecO [Geobacteraceae bacterium]|nr:DNA repair protein RecO [Geobacteraceae bacterium]